MAKMRIGVSGCAGRMGQMILKQIAASDEATISGGVERAGHPALGADVGETAGIRRLGLTIGSDIRQLFAQSEAVLEFTMPEATATHAAIAGETGKIHVIGTTGLGPAEEQALGRAARRAPIVLAPNMSVGINLLMAVVERVARTLGSEYDIEILEMHHRHKVDAPSGTALGLGRAAAAGRGVPLGDNSVRVRDGHTGARPAGAIGFAVLRGGDVVGDHSVIFAAPGERLELTHRAASREIYARGALRAALWARGKPPGLYGMADVLGFERS